MKSMWRKNYKFVLHCTITNIFTPSTLFKKSICTFFHPLGNPNFIKALQHLHKIYTELVYLKLKSFILLNHYRGWIVDEFNIRFTKFLKVIFLSTEILHIMSDILFENLTNLLLLTNPSVKWMLSGKLALSEGLNI